MNVIKYCGFAFITLAISFILSEFKPKLSKLIVVTIGAGLLCVGAASLYPSIKYIKTLMENSVLKSYASTLLKALGVALAVEICADICKDAGETSLASKLEIIGKAELLLLALPLIGELLEKARGLLQ